jgi:hypothetical protein
MEYSLADLDKQMRQRLHNIRQFIALSASGVAPFALFTRRAIMVGDEDFDCATDAGD